MFTGAEGVLKPMKTIKTVLHVYDYDTNRDAGPAGVWTNLEIALRHTPGRGRIMNSFCDQTMSAMRAELETGPVELETGFLFENQWNSSNGLRLFDWFLEAVPGKPNIKRGHYLDITPEMIRIRRETYSCNYCGAMVPEAQIGNGLHTDCLGNVYLKESELLLVRLIRICDQWKKPLALLSEQERAWVLPIYLKAQMEASAAAREKQRAAVLAEFEKDSNAATVERDGFLWLLDHGLQTENVIFYSHTGKFSFGWRSKYTGEAREVLLAALARFPFPYDVV